MLQILDLTNISSGELPNVLPRPKVHHQLPTDAVRDIIEEVQLRGDQALIELTERFDGVHIFGTTLAKDEMERGYRAISPTLREALEAAHGAIQTFHEAELRALASMAEVSHHGLAVQTRFVPVERAGCYVPGGKARYPSSVLMTAGIAKAAGVSEVLVCVPPTPDGLVDDATLAACWIAGVDLVIPVGGAQAIAAMAYGTHSIPKVDVIVGPGNIYVSVAKREVAQVVGVPSSFAGPSEVIVIADSTVPAKWAAIDVAVQAEHGPDGLAWLITWDRDYAEEVIAELESYVKDTPRGNFILSTLREGGYAAVVRDRDQAMEVSNFIAPEHLELLYFGAEADVELVRCAGAVFVGRSGSAAFGDYVSGPSHVLPTFGTARFSSALGVSDFLRRIHVVEVDTSAAPSIGWAVEAIAEVEGLAAHADSISIRNVVQGA